jgi:hypothetical protein
MGFIFILLAVLGITTVAYLAKVSVKNGISSFDFTFVTFAVAGVLGYSFAKLNNVNTADYTAELCCVSAIAGICGATAVFFFNNAIRIGQLLISHNRLSSFAYLFASYASGFIMISIFFCSGENP